MRPAGEMMECTDNRVSDADWALGVLDRGIVEGRGGEGQET